jgi:hypothetical protein
MADRNAALIGNLSRGVAAGGAVVQPIINVETPPGHTADVSQRSDGQIDVLVRQIESRIARSIATGGVIARQLGSSFNVKRRVR